LDAFCRFSGICHTGARATSFFGSPPGLTAETPQIDSWQPRGDSAILRGFQGRRVGGSQIACPNGFSARRPAQYLSWFIAGTAWVPPNGRRTPKNGP